jgi:hypothetical protein
MSSLNVRIAADRILDREISRAAVEPYRVYASPALAAVVDYGLATFERCSATAKTGDENFGILFSALHVFEMLDGADILLREGAVAPAYPLLRSAFEGMLVVEFITENDTQRRGAAYVVEEIHRQLREKGSLDKDTDRGKQLLAEIAKDQHGLAIEFPPSSELKVQIESLEKALSRPHLKEAVDEYARLKKLKKRSAFYSFWGGPASIQQLAQCLKRGAQYEILYRWWSRTAHGGDLPRQASIFENQTAVRVFRSADGIGSIYSLAITLGLVTITKILLHYRAMEVSGGTFSQWYIDTVRPAYLALNLTESTEVLEASRPEAAQVQV